MADGKDVFDTLRIAVEHAKSEGATEPGDKAPIFVADLEAWLAEIERLQLRAGNITKIFVATINFGHEGHTPPIQAFLSEIDANAALRFCDAGSHCAVDFFAVPVWPEPAVRWMDQKPIGRDEP